MRKALSLVVPMLALGIGYDATDAAPSVAVALQRQDPCPPPFQLEAAELFQFEDRNRNFLVCRMTTPGGHVVTIDDHET